MLAKTFGGAVYGVDAQLITIEVNVTAGRHFFISGLADNAVRESQHRVESAIKNLRYDMPRTKVVVNLAPADLRKEGSAYDLPIALALLKASGQIATLELEQSLIMGELALDGALRPIRGALPIAVRAAKEGFKRFVLPLANAYEAAVVEGIDIIAVASLREATEFVEGKAKVDPVTVDKQAFFERQALRYAADFCDVQGQESIKRAMEIAAAGGHNVIMIGPPGSGKTMLASRLPSILPPLTLPEALETTKIYSVVGKMEPGAALLTARPFRAPHHTISDVALVGGGGYPQPGEISLAHNGVLFLDELPEFKRAALEVMRQPMEERRVTIARAKMSIDYPANFMLIAGMNPCPCGYYNHPEKECVCPQGAVQRYISRVSGPLLDRIDLHVEVTPVRFENLTDQQLPEKSESIRQRVRDARTLQQSRFGPQGAVHSNAMMGVALLRKHCALDADSQALLKMAMTKLGLSARGHDSLLKVSRTIADLAQSERIEPPHLAEAIQYRTLDRSGSGLR